MLDDMSESRHNSTGGATSTSTDETFVCGQSLVVPVDTTPDFVGHPSSLPMAQDSGTDPGLMIDCIFTVSRYCEGSMPFFFLGSLFKFFNKSIPPVSLCILLSPPV